MLFLAAAVISVEALAAAVFGVLEVLAIHPDRFVVGAGGALLSLGYAVLLVVVARGVALGRSWSRGPAVATQLLQGLLGTSFTGSTWLVGLALVVTAVVALVCVVVPAATAEFTRRGGTAVD